MRKGITWANNCLNVWKSIIFTFLFFSLLESVDFWLHSDMLAMFIELQHVNYSYGCY